MTGVPGGGMLRIPEPVAGLADVLFVCHANQCRSPYLEAIAERLSARASVGARERLRFRSAGLLGGGHRMPGAGVRVGSELGFDFTGHRSRRIDLDDLARFDLIVTAARAQARELVAADPAIRARVFTLRQLSRWVADQRRPRRAALGPWLDVVAAGRSADDLIGADADDDIPDPLRRPPAAWRRMAADETPRLRRIVDALG